MKYYFTYKKPGKDEAQVRTYETREEAMRYWVELTKTPGIETYSHVDFAVDEQHCVAKSLIYWSDKGYYKPESLVTPDNRKKIYLPTRSK